MEKEKLQNAAYDIAKNLLKIRSSFKAEGRDVAVYDLGITNSFTQLGIYPTLIQANPEKQNKEIFGYDSLKFGNEVATCYAALVLEDEAKSSDKA